MATLLSCEHPRRPRGCESILSQGGRAPGDIILQDLFQTVAVVLVSDRCQKIFVFFCPIRVKYALESFRVFKHGDVQEAHLSRLCSFVFIKIKRKRNFKGEFMKIFKEVFNQKVLPDVGLPREIFNFPSWKRKCFFGINQMPEQLRPFGTSLVRQCRGCSQLC